MTPLPYFFIKENKTKENPFSSLQIRKLFEFINASKTNLENLSANDEFFSEDKFKAVLEFNTYCFLADFYFHSTNSSHFQQNLSSRLNHKILRYLEVTEKVLTQM